MTTTTAPETFTVYTLAMMADCNSPSTPTSAGADFLIGVQDATRDAWEEAPDGERTVDALDYDGRLHEIADGAVPIYTADVWATFIDLGAYHEDPTDMGADGSDMEKAAQVCLYLIADRLTRALVEAWAEAADDDDETDS